MHTPEQAKPITLRKRTDLPLVSASSALIQVQEPPPLDNLINHIEDSIKMAQRLSVVV